MQGSCQKGYTMIEVVATISILIMVITGMSKTVSHMFGRYKFNEALTQIRDLRKVISDRFAATGDYSTLSAKLLIDEKLAPGNMVASPVTMVNSFGGAVTVTAAKTYGTGKSFSITFNSLPRQVCVEAANINWRVDDTSSLISIMINNKKPEFTWPINKISSVSPASTDLPMTMPKAQAACNSNTDKNTITWEFQ